MNEFTFVVLTYNHEKYIIDNLNSIKELVKKYGSNKEIDLIISDDCSKDKTTFAAQEWIKNNRSFFKNCKIITTKSNSGIVRNLLNAVNNVRTRDFKFIAGDDSFRLENIFYLYENIMYKNDNNNLILSPVTPFGTSGKEYSDFYYDEYRFVKYWNDKKKLTMLLKINNYLQAPGVFIPGNYLRDKNLQNFLLGFKNIEDYPLWYYLIVKKKVPVLTDDTSYINYRLGSGITTNENIKKKSGYNTELDEIHKKLHMKAYILPKFINPWRYQVKIMRIFFENAKQ